MLPHWAPATRERFPHGHRHDVASGELHSPFFPLRGTYSSRDPSVLDAQMAELMRAGVGAVVLSWWGQASREGTSDTQGVQTDHTIGHVVAAVERAGGGLRWAVHMEPYPGRSAESVAEDVRYLVERCVCARVSGWVGGWVGVGAGVGVVGVRMWVEAGRGDLCVCAHVRAYVVCVCVG